MASQVLLWGRSADQPLEDQRPPDPAVAKARQTIAAAKEFAASSKITGFWCMQIFEASQTHTPCESVMILREAGVSIEPAGRPCLGMGILQKVPM